MNEKNAESVKEYGLIDFSFTDTVHVNEKDKMIRMIFTSNPNDKLYSYNEQKELTPKYYLPFYINIFNKTIKDIKKTELKNLFTKDFVDFITITLKQPLSSKTCISFIKDKSLIEKFISEYKKKHPDIKPEQYSSSSADKYKIFMENVYVFLIKIILTPAGSFISKAEKPDGDEDAANQKKLYYIADTSESNITKQDIYYSITRFIQDITTKSSLKTTSYLELNDDIKLSFLKNKELSALTKTILDAIFKKQEQIIIKEQSYDFKSELDYNKILKDKVLTKLQDETKSLYKKNNYKDAFPSTGPDKESLNQLVKQIADVIKELNDKKGDSNIFKNTIEIKNDVERILKLYYIEKEKNIQQREKKIYIEITITKDNFTKVDLKSITYEGAPTFSDITKFQKELQEQISKFIQNCQSPKDIQENIKKECTTVCSKPNTKNQLWCSICTNYIQCVYDKDYIGKPDEAEAEAEKAAEAEAKAAAKKAEVEKAEAKKAAAVKNAANKLIKIINKAKDGGGNINKNAKKRTISKHKLLKPQSFNKSVKVIINQ